MGSSEMIERRSFFGQVGDFLHGEGDFVAEGPSAGRLRWLVLFVVVCGIFYGAVMGCFTGLGPGRYQQLLYSGVKVPLLLLVTFLLCLPSFFVVNSVAGLRSDFARAMRAVVAAQACMTLVLAALAPLTGVLYLSITDYQVALGINGVMFAVASGTAQIVVRRYYAPLIRSNPLHRRMLYVWYGLYVFVGIQMGYVLRPFVGNPSMDVTFFRAGAWGNAYVVVARIIEHSARRLMGW